jgi:hypothetical protein
MGCRNSRLIVGFGVGDLYDYGIGPFRAVVNPFSAHSQAEKLKALLLFDILTPLHRFTFAEFSSMLASCDQLHNLEDCSGFCLRQL